MKKQDSQQDLQQKSHSTGFGVDPSPFNGVKLELGFVIIIGIVLWIGIDFIISSSAKQLMLLACYGFFAAIWITIRTRRILKQLQSDHI